MIQPPVGSIGRRQEAQCDRSRCSGSPGTGIAQIIKGLGLTNMQTGFMDRLVGRHLTLDGVEKADEFLMPVALHFAHGSWSSAAIATMFALGRVNAGRQTLKRAAAWGARC